MAGWKVGWQQAGCGPVALRRLAAVSAPWPTGTGTVVDGRISGGGPAGTVADCCCPHINFHTDQAAADAYRRAHPGMTAMLLDQAEAVQAARKAFGGLLDPSNPPEEAP
jgi:hypothetical protein